MNFRRVKIETLWLVALTPSGGLEGKIEVFSVRAEDRHSAKKVFLEWLAQEGRPVGKDQVRNRGRLSQVLGQKFLRKARTEHGESPVLLLEGYDPRKGQAERRKGGVG